MANKVTGSNDTTGALSIAPSTPKSVMIIGKSSVSSNDVERNKITSITGTTDTINIFGEDSIVADMVKVLIMNGVNNISAIVVDIPEQGSTSDEEYATVVSDAYDSALMTSMDDDTVKVVLLDTNKYIELMKTHLALCESNDMFRYSVILPDNTVKSQADYIAYAKTIDDDRIFSTGTAMIDKVTAKEVDPVLGAAGLGAVIMTETSDPALPLNGVQIKGFGGVIRKMLDAEKQVLANSGVTPLYTEGSLPTIFRLVTTNVSDKVWQEGTTRFIADYVLESVENTLRANYKRTKNVDRILGDTGIRGTVKSVLQTMNDLEIIENFDESTLTVIKDPKDMYGALVDYEIDVVTPLYTITISQHIKL